MDIINFDAEQNLNNSIIQMMAESYWEEYFDGITDNSTEKQKKDLFSRQLQYGNTTIRDILPEKTTNTTKTSVELGNYAAENFEIVDYKNNDITGFACILVKNKNTGEYTLAFRSTEYNSSLDPLKIDVAADQDITDNGYSIGQIASMENYYQNVLKAKIPPESTLNISGYSLGGHLANAFYLMHKNEISNMSLFNAPGVGFIDGQGYQTGNNISGDRIKQMAETTLFLYNNINTLLYKNITEDGITTKVLYSKEDIVNNIGKICFLDGTFQLKANTTLNSITQDLIDSFNRYQNVFSPEINKLFFQGILEDAQKNNSSSLISTNIDRNIYTNDSIYSFVRKVVTQIYNTSSAFNQDQSIPFLDSNLYLAGLNSFLYGNDLGIENNIIYNQNNINNLYGGGMILF